MPPPPLFFNVLLGAIKPTIANKNRTSTPYFFLFYVPMAQLCGEALISPFLFCAYGCNSTRELCAQHCQQRGSFSFIIFVLSSIVIDGRLYLYALWVILLFLRFVSFYANFNTGV
jgi:hypothetical protein